MPERLIDANALLHNMCCLDGETQCDAEDCIRYKERKYIETAPTIDAEPVRHGRMIDGRYPNENKCSECGQEFRDDIGFIIQDDDGVFYYPKRCPECGCYWDGGAEND